MSKKTFFLFAVVLVTVTACSDKEDAPSNSQLINEVNAIDAYLDANVTDFVAYDQSGIRIVIHEFGENPPPHTGQTVKATYTGKLFSDNTIFENGDLNTKLENISVEGLRFSISALLAGSRATFYIPSLYAYGTAGRSGVPANATVVYENVTLNEVVRTSTEQTQFELDTAAIHEHIKKNRIPNAVAHPSGVWYTIDEVGSGDSPEVYNTVAFTYTGSILSTGAVFDSGTTSSNIFGLIDGLKVGMPLMQENTKATFYIPSGLGYGPVKQGSIPANSNLRFVIELKEFVQ
jgi:FKBP-type peptidyl-prolyl cis-trans isomerase